MRIAKTALAAAALAAASILGTAQIERLDLTQMVSKADNAVVGKIVEREVIRIDHPVDGPELYYTHLTIDGRSLVDGEKLSVVVTFAGGFIDDENGVWNSEAPTAEETAVGKNVVAFYQWTDNMGGDLAANALYAAHGGLYRTVEGRTGTVVQGRGEGYAVANNIKLGDLDAQITKISQQIDETGGQQKND
jgi:hypothetical protein